MTNPILQTALRLVQAGLSVIVNAPERPLTNGYKGYQGYRGYHGYRSMKGVVSHG